MLESQHSENVTPSYQLSDYAGINYGSYAGSNVDHATGIHYGVIDLNSLSGYAIEAFEPDYGYATCPKCGNAATSTTYLDPEIEESEGYESGVGCADYYCANCRYIFDAQEAYPEEPLGHSYEGGEYILDLDSFGVWVFTSLYYTYAQYCSPCCPGAGNLDTPCTQESGAPKAYCLGHDWFDGDKAPYPVYRVSDDSLVQPS